MSKARAPTRLERSDAQAPADSESEMSWLVREEARARGRSSLLVARLRAANEATQAGGGFVPEPNVLEYKRQEKAAARCVGTSREASPIGGVSCASDARETSETHVFLRRGDVGVAQRRRRKGEVGAASAGTRAVGRPPSRSDGRRARRRGAFEGGARVRAGRRVLCATR